MQINTDIERVVVEIDGAEYEVAEKTAAVADKLIEAQVKCAGRAEYHLWLAELEILLGKTACKELFNLGKNENLDRLERIHAGVIEAFERNHDDLAAEKADRAAEQMAKLFAPLNEFLRRSGAQSQGGKVVRRKE